MVLILNSGSSSARRGAPYRCFCLKECLMDSGIAGEPKLLAQAHLVTTPEPDIPAAAGNPKYTTHRFDAELCPMIFDGDILHFRRFAKYVAAFWRMASSSACSASCRLRRTFSAASSLSRSDELICCCCLLRQA